MTAAAVEQDQADAPEVSPRAAHLAAYLEHVTGAEKELRLAIAAELAEGLPVLWQAWEKASEMASAAYGALEAPRKVKEDRDAEVAQAEAELAGWRSQAEDESTPFAERVRLRAQIADGEAELELLRQKADFAQAQLLPFLDAYAKAEAEFEKADLALAGAKLNATQALAFRGAGLKTAGYAWRFGLALEGVLRDRDHPEHDAAVDHMLHLCVVSGFRTEDHRDELPSDAELARRSWDQLYADPVAHPIEPVPSGQDLMAMDRAMMTDAALQESPSRIDDYRPSSGRSAPPRDYMKLPGR